MDGAGPYARVNFGPNGALFGTTQGGGGSAGCNTDTYPDLFRDISPNLYEGCGTVFSLQPPPMAQPPAAWLEKVLYRFTGGSDGALPAVGDLNFDLQGNIYGNTYAGGVNVSCGVVFELTRAGNGWSEAALYTFSGETDGCSPNAVTFGPSGDLYGTTMTAGAQNLGTIFQLAPAGPPWTAATLYSFPGATTGEMPLAGVIFDSLGNMYGSNVIQGPGGGGTVFELALSGGVWNFSTLYSFNGAGYGPRAALVVDAAGNLYGTTEQDGLYGYGNVFELTPTGNGTWTYTSLYDFHGGNDGGYPVSNLVFDASGNLYGTASQGGTGFGCSRGCGVVFKITP